MLPAQSSRSCNLQQRRTFQKGLTALQPQLRCGLDMARPAWWPLPHINLELTRLAAPCAGGRQRPSPDSGAGSRGVGWVAPLSPFTDVADHLMGRAVSRPIHLFFLKTVMYLHCKLSSYCMALSHHTAAPCWTLFLPDYYS